MLMPGRHYSNGDLEYRYAFNGKEKDSEWSTGAKYDYGFRIYDGRLGKFLSVDPLSPNYPMLTPYQFASNTPIMAIDLDGLEAKVVITYLTEEGKADGTLVITEPKEVEYILRSYEINVDELHNVDYVHVLVGPDGSFIYNTIEVIEESWEDKLARVTSLEGMKNGSFFGFKATLDRHAEDNTWFAQFIKGGLHLVSDNAKDDGTAAIKKAPTVDRGLDEEEVEVGAFSSGTPSASFKGHPKNAAPIRKGVGVLREAKFDGGTAKQARQLLKGGEAAFKVIWQQEGSDDSGLTFGGPSYRRDERGSPDANGTTRPDSLLVPVIKIDNKGKIDTSHFVKRPKQ